MHYTPFIETVCEGAVPAVRDQYGRVIVFETERQAQQCIAEHAISIYCQVLSGDMDLEDCSVEEFVGSVEIDGFGMLASGDEYIFDGYAYDETKRITAGMKMLVNADDFDDDATAPYDIYEVCVDPKTGCFVNLIVRYASRTEDGTDDIVGWGIEQMSKDQFDTEETSVYSIATLEAFVGWLLEEAQGGATEKAA